MKDLNAQLTLKDLALEIKKSVASTIHCIMPAFFSSVVEAFDYTKNYGIIAVRPIPLQGGQEPYTLYVYTLTNTEYAVNDLLTIGFTDYEFVKNLNVMNKDQIELASENLHSMTSGVVINGPIKPRILTSAPTASTPGYIGEVVYVIDGGN